MKLYDMEDVCAFLKIGKSTLYRLIKEERIPYIKVGGSVRFIEEQLVEWVKSRGVQ